MRRYSLLGVALLFVVSGCTGSDGGPARPGADATSNPVESVIPLGGTYWGDFESQPGLSGRVKIQVAEGGDVITGLDLFYEMEEYACDAATLTVELGVLAPLGIEVPVAGGAFSYGSGPIWDGVFVSESRVEGSVEGTMMVGGGPSGPPRECEIGRLPWSAQLEGSSD